VKRNDVSFLLVVTSSTNTKDLTQHIADTNSVHKHAHPNVFSLGSANHIATTIMASQAVILRRDAFSSRLPTPPRIVVPPPTANIHLAPEFDLHSNAKSGPLSEIDYTSMTTSSLLDWSYERRRQAQQILPFLYLGPMSAVKDANFLRDEGITLLMAVRQRHSFESKIMQAALNVADHVGIDKKALDMSSAHELVASFSRAAITIDEHMNSRPAAKVFIFCESGNERSAAVMAAYLMHTLADVDHIRAMQIVQAQRFCVNFDDNVKRLLQGYWDLLQARRCTANMNSGGRPKRLLERDADNDGMDIDAHRDSGHDAERFTSRTFAPFVDTGL
jgi:serine/threonine/tyrosine-interacting protein